MTLRLVGTVAGYVVRRRASDGQYEAKVHYIRPDPGWGQREVRATLVGLTSRHARNAAAAWLLEQEDRATHMSATVRK